MSLRSNALILLINQTKTISRCYSYFDKKINIEKLNYHEHNIDQ